MVILYSVASHRSFQVIFPVLKVFKDISLHLKSWDGLNLFLAPPYLLKKEPLDSRGLVTSCYITI